jgi:predicted nucleic acid-binding protein
MFDTNAISALVHHRAGWEQFARRIDGLATDQRLISTITLSELQTMIAKAEAPEAKSYREYAGVCEGARSRGGELASLNG